MHLLTRRGARLAAVIGTAVAVSVTVAAPASAAAGDTHSRGILCTGLVTCGPFAASNFPAGPASNSTVGTTAVAGLLTAGVINTTANATGATASVANLAVTLSPTSALTADAVSSSCTIAQDGTVSGSSSIVNGVVTVAGVQLLTLTSMPAPNTTVAVTGIPGVASITLNKQDRAADGTLTVTAISITLLNGQTIDIAQSSCSPVPLIGVPMIAPAFAIGTGVLALLVLGTYLVRRRRHAVAGLNA